MNSKEEAIKKAYGEFYEEMKPFIDKDGWCVNRKICGFYNSLKGKQNHPKINYWFRPLELNGIEKNNGWIKIESENDLPKNDGEYWIITKSQIIVHAYFEVGDIRFTQNGRDFYRGLPTHYQPIQKPQPPIY